MIKKKKQSKMTLDKLAIMVANGFESVDKRFSDVNKRFDDMEIKMATKDDIKEVKTKIEGVNNRIDDISENRVKYTEFNTLKKRVDILEKKI